MALALPASTEAHGLIQRATLPIPEELFVAAAVIVLVVSFVALGVLWPQPQMAADRWRALGGRRWLRVVDAAAGVAGVVLLVAVIGSGFGGSEDPLNNFATAFVFIVFWVGLAFASVLLGNVFHALSPWRALGRVLRLEGVRPYPDKLGRWPAVAGLLAFAWIELASGWGEDPRTLALAVTGYTVLTLAAQYVYGTETWTERGEAFAVYFSLLGRLAPVERRGDTIGLRPPLVALTRLEPMPGTVALLMAMIGTVTFDGLSQGTVWANLTDGDDSRVVATLGILAAVTIVSAFYALGARDGEGRRAFAHSLVPIAMVYVAAHYLSYLAYEGQSIVYLSSDPLGEGWNLFGTASATINYGWLSQNAVWYLQVGFVVVGHVAALTLAHDRALEVAGSARAAVRSQLRMLVVMVGFTGLALWLLSAPQGASSSDRGVAATPDVVAPSDRLVDLSRKPPFVNSLERDEDTGELLLTTNRGFYRIDPETDAVTEESADITEKGQGATLGTFLEVDAAPDGTLVGSGHPDPGSKLPQYLGFLRSTDDGATWDVVSRFGLADLHKIVYAHDRVYAWDAVLSAMLISQDEGKTFTEHFTPRGLIVDFEVDPADPDHLLAATDDQLFESANDGDSWRPALRAAGVRLAWTAPDTLYVATADGRVQLSSDGGETYEDAGRVDGEPAVLKALGETELLMALTDGTVLHTRDGGASWTEDFRP